MVRSTIRKPKQWGGSNGGDYNNRNRRGKRRLRGPRSRRPGQVTMRKRLVRKHLLEFMSKLPACLLRPAYHSDRFACRQKERTRGGRRRMRRSARRA